MLSAAGVKDETWAWNSISLSVNLGQCSWLGQLLFV